ncbi:hypothetical protein [Enhygromyxa salina]|uniref:Uncharacterized protein n=1 Tax=Enhygromyxa salina TaxID=215803 RepID=A0A2S9YWR1_9BACT|nr:hypothetical protein [Enhygromyxa salina]PRQ09536.1 hypothetical protein ENSA7_07780 [Enhygromyxa salina]
MLGAQTDPKDVTLPPPGEREWLIGQTAKLLAHPRHVSAYLRAPLLEATPAYFPDRWAGGEASVRRLLLRLLRYAGHPQHDVVVVIHEEDPARRGEVIAKPAPMRGKDPVAWFVRRDAEVLHFACELSALREPENLVPALARAVAHAHRVIAGVESPDNQRLIDVTGVVLGFGLLTTDACQRFYARNDGGFRTTRAESRLGALSVQDMSFLLAMQLEARGIDRRTRRRLLAKQQPNQAGFVREAQAWLTQQQPTVRARLGLPQPAQWPAPHDLEALTGPLEDPRRSASPEQLTSGSGVFDSEDLDERDDDEVSEHDHADDEPRRDIDLGIRGANRGKPVFRIERSGALRMAKLLGFPVLMIGGLLSRGNFGVDVPMQIVAPVAIGLAVLGLAVGSLFTDRRCSEPKCGSALREADRVCPLCGGVVMDVIHHPRERLGADEELVRKGKVTAEGLVVGWDEDANEDGDDDDDDDDDDVEPPRARV